MKKISKKKIILLIIGIILLILILGDVLVANYLVSFALKRTEPDSGKNVSPKSDISAEIQNAIDENTVKLSESTEYWLETLTSEQAEIQSDDGLSLKAEILGNPENTHSWVIIVHGYGWEHTKMYDYVGMYAERGYQILMPDLRGCGESEGDYVGMGWLDRKDMVKWVDFLCERDSEAEIVLHGVSMGGATVVMTAGEDLPDNVKAIVDDCGYTSVWDIFSDELSYLYHLPDFPFMYTADVISQIRAGYGFKEASALEQIKKTKVPVLFIHGTADSFVHPEMGYTLYDACPTEKELYTTEGVGHARSLYFDPVTYAEKVFQFLDNLQ